MKPTRIFSRGSALVLWVLLLFFPGFAVAQQGGFSDRSMGPGMMGGWGIMGWFGGIFMLVVWVLVIVGLIFLIKWLVQSTRTEPGAPRGDSSGALNILRERYARGEIDKTEFEEKKKDLLS